MGQDLARRGLAGSGVEQSVLASTYQQEAMAKAQAGQTARGTALEQSEAIRQQQAGYAGSQLQAGVSGMQTGYQAEQAGIQNIYGVTASQALQNYNLQNAATLQGISGLTQVAQAGQGVYAGSQNYISSATNAASQGASIAGSTAANLNMSSTTTTTAPKQDIFGTVVGGVVGAYTGGFGTAIGSAMGSQFGNAIK
jgi:hypothetical protein